MFGFYFYQGHYFRPLFTQIDDRPVYSTQGLGILESLCPNKKGATGDSYVYGRQAILLSS
jgi:hypothetical protein